MERDGQHLFSRWLRVVAFRDVRIYYFKKNCIYIEHVTEFTSSEIYAYSPKCECASTTLFNYVDKLELGFKHVI